MKSVKRTAAFVAIGVLMLFMVLEIFWAESNPLSIGGAILGIAILTFIWGWIIWTFGNSNWVSWGTVGAVAFLLLCSGGDLIARILGESSPVIEVKIDNSVDLYPMPPEDDPTSPKWLDEKFVIHPGEGAQKVAIAGWLGSILAFGIASAGAWIITKIPIPAIRRIQVPISLVFLLIWTGISIWAISSPVNTPGMDEPTAKALEVQWWLGFFRTLWWSVVVLQGIPFVLHLFTRGIIATRIDVLVFAVAAFSWLALPIITTVFDPTTVSWTLCTRDAYETGVTVPLCQEAFASGKMAMLAISMAWAWLRNLIWS